MPSLLTVSGIWNLALDTIREAAVQDQATNSAPMKWLNRNYEHARDVLLQSYPWNFAIEAFELPSDGAYAVSTWDWKYRYALPNNWLRVLAPTYQGRRGNQVIPHAIRGPYLYLDYGTPARVLIVMRKTDPGDFSPLFVEALAAKLALGMANKFTAKNKYIELAGNMLSNAIAKAEEVDTFEGSPEPIDNYDIIAARA